MNPATPIYLDWGFWAVVVALLALVLSQLPPVHLMLRPRRLEVEVHSRIQITHHVGNPNIGLFLSIRNTGGRVLRIRKIQIDVERDGKPLGRFPAQNFFESPSSQTPALFIPFSLRPGEDWSHGASFLNFFDRQTEKTYRASLSALNADIGKKLQARPSDDGKAVNAEEALVAPFLALFDKLFVWEPGEYVVALTVDAEPGSASYLRKYRFTLYESDTVELRAHANDYKFGGGISYNLQQHAGVFVPLAEHASPKE